MRGVLGGQPPDKKKGKKGKKSQAEPEEEVKHFEVSRDEEMPEGGRTEPGRAPALRRAPWLTKHGANRSMSACGRRRADTGASVSDDEDDGKKKRKRRIRSTNPELDMDLMGPVWPHRVGVTSAQENDRR